jgi:hypothetical protein
MADLAQFERVGDYLGAQWYVDDIYHHYDLAPQLESMFELRSLAYEARRFGFEAVAPMFEAFLTGEEDFEAQSQAMALQALETEPGTSLLVWWSPQHPDMFLDGRLVDPATDGNGLYYYYFPMKPGFHLVGLRFRGLETHPEFQFLWRTRSAIYWFEQGGITHLLPSDNSDDEAWAKPDYNTETWTTAEVTTSPFVYEAPANGFMDLHGSPLIHGSYRSDATTVFRLSIELPPR